MWRGGSVIEDNAEAFSAPTSPSTSEGDLPLPPPPPSSQISSVTDAGEEGGEDEKYVPPPVRSTNIQVCVRLRPILAGDSASPLVVPRQQHAGPGGPRPDRHFATPTNSSRRLGGGGGGSARASGLQPPGSGTRRSGLQPPGSSGGGASSPRDRRRKGASSRKLAESAGGDDASTATTSSTSSGSSLTGPPPSCAWEIPAEKKPTTIYQSPSTDPDPARKSAYVVDRVFGPGSRTSGLYTEAVRDVVRASMEGYHGSVFAYGQTSTGKTYTMTGTPNDPGVVPLAVRDCFRYIQKERSGVDNREYLLRVSYMEIYNEQIYDLLVESPARPSSSAGPVVPPQSNIRIFESKTEGVVVRGLHEEIVTSPEQVFALLAAGEARRRTGSTALNRQSSRSHSIFRLLVESRIRRGPRTAAQVEDGGMADSDSFATGVSSAVGAGGPVRVSSLSLVDLAGSESVKATGATGSRQKEGQYINKSLMTLGHVVYKLSEMSMLKDTPGARMPSRAHIPYRDSKLTRLLQPSLSGNAQICIVCNVSPLVRNLDESHNTLKFATRAKKIKQTAKVTEVVDDKTLLQNYREEIEALKAQLHEAKEAHKRALEEAARSGVGSGGSSISNSDGEEKKAENLAPSTPNTAGGGIADEDDLLADLDPVAAADEDAQVIAAAIKDLENLILKKKTSSARKRGSMDSSGRKGSKSEKGKGRKGSIFAVAPGGIDDILEKEGGAGSEGDDEEENLLDGILSSPTPAAPASKVTTPAATPAKDGMYSPADLAKTRFATPGGREEEDDDDDDDVATTTTEDTDQEVLLGELHRIRSVLNSVLKRKAVGGGAGPPTTPSAAGGGLGAGLHLQSPGIAAAVGNTPRRDEEVEKLRAQLHEQEVATSLRKADSSFLQSQLQEKDNLLKEVSKILEAVEKRQVELEADNAHMKKILAQRAGEVRSKDLEIQRLRNQLANRAYGPEKIQEEDEDEDEDDELFSSLI